MTAPSERFVDGIATAVFDGAVYQLYTFARIDLPAPNGILRYTDYPQGYVGDIDGAGSQTWLHAALALSNMNWSQITPDDVAWLDIWNVDNVWSTLILNYDVEFKPIRIWQGWFNPATGAIYGRPLMWQGRTDQVGTQGGTTMRIALVPSRSNIGVTAPWAICATTCQHVYKDGRSCQYAGIANPASLTVTDGGSGLKGPGTYFYAVTALHGSEETAAATGSVVLANNHKANLSWPAVTGATGYNVYYGTTSTVHNLTLAANIQTNSYVDNAGSPPVGTNVPPVSNGTGVNPGCDHSFSDCGNHGNRQHFGGFPNMNSKPVLWSQRG